MRDIPTCLQAQTHAQHARVHNAQACHHIHPPTQASLFRAVADFYEYQDPLISTNMRDSADFFETLAIEVQTCAFEEDHQDQANVPESPFQGDFVK